jgi:RNA polymerase sigma-54 factor
LSAHTSLELRADHRQVQTLSPRLQQAVRLLQMSSLDFAAIVRGKLGENPFLEDDETVEPAVPAVDGVLPADAEPVTFEPDGSTDVFGGDDRDLWHSEVGGGQRRAEDGDITAMDMMAVETTLAMHLHGQLNVLPLTPRDLMMARTLVESLDDDGYLRTPLEELLSVAPVKPPATLDEMRIALRRVQSLDPPGVCGRSVLECLQLQLPAIACPDMRALAGRIITDHLQALTSRDVTALAAKLGERPARVKEACDLIRRFDPRPGWRYGPAQIAYVIPDVVVKKRRNQWTVQLNPAVVPRIRLNRVYADLFQRHRRTDNAEMAGHLEEARWTVRNVEQRFATILDVASAIVRRQRHFLDYGPMAMKPLLLREIADECHIHESTVSRVTNNKYMATPSGVFELKYFFSRAIVSANGSACSGTAIRGLIKDIIEAENPAHPLSDADIRRQLVGQGLMVARRTVTKYRQMLQIESVERRRQR